MNIVILVVVISMSAGVIGWLIWRNMKDEKKLEQQLNEDYPKPKEHSGDTEEGGEPEK